MANPIFSYPSQYDPTIFTNDEVSQRLRDIKDRTYITERSYENHSQLEDERKRMEEYREASITRQLGFPRSKESQFLQLAEKHGLIRVGNLKRLESETRNKKTVSGFYQHLALCMRCHKLTKSATEIIVHLKHRHQKSYNFIRFQVAMGVPVD